MSAVIAVVMELLISAFVGLVIGAVVIGVFAGVMAVLDRTIWRRAALALAALVVG